MTIAVTLLGAAVLQVPASTVHAQSCHFRPGAGAGEPSWHGRYVNTEYQYEVTIPSGLVGFGNPEPAPQHGIGITLGGVGQGYVWVDGSWNSLAYKTARQKANDFLSSMRENGATIEEVKRQRVSVDGRTGERMLVRYRCPGDAADSNYDYVAMLGPKRSIEWTMALDTPSARYPEDRRILDAIIKSWKHVPSDR